MLDPDEQAAYEAWKGRKLIGQHDLSVNAFNTEMEALAIAYENGAKAAHKNSDDLTSILLRSPYRSAGMTGARTTKKIAEKEEEG